LAEVFLDDRRKKIEFLHRYGEIVPGLEYETISAKLAGEPDPPTNMRSVVNPEFLETEIIFILDTSDSMSGAPLDQSNEFMVINTESFKRLREMLADEQLLVHEDEQPFRIGMTKYSVNPERVTKLDEPLSERKQLIMLERGSMVGGGTDEVEAVKSEYKELTLEKKNVIKIVFLLTDGHGNREGIAPIMRQIESDDEVIFMVFAVGNNVDEVAIFESYIGPLRDKRQGKNIFAFAARDPKTVIPHGIEFLRREVWRKRDQMGM